MRIVLGMAIGAGAVAVMAALLNDFPQFKVWEKLPEWSQAIGTVGAIVAAIWIAHRDRENARADAAAAEINTRRRVVAALAAEVQQIAVTAAMHIRVGRNVAAGGMFDAPSRGITLTTGQVYGALGSWVGILPERLLEQIISFYSSTRDTEEVSRQATNMRQMYVSLLDPIVNIAVVADVIAEQLRRYLAGDCSDDVNLRIPFEFIYKIADKHGCPREKAKSLFSKPVQFEPSPPLT